MKINIATELKKRDLEDFENDRGFHALENSYIMLSESFDSKKKRKIEKMLSENVSSEVLSRYITEDEDVSAPAKTDESLNDLFYRMAKFVEDFDPYDYADVYTDIDCDKFIEAVHNGELQSYIDEIQFMVDTYKEDDADMDYSKDITEGEQLLKTLTALNREDLKEATTVTHYSNKRNPHKHLEVHNDGHGHRSVKQYIKHTADDLRKEFPDKEPYSEEPIINTTGDGALHRMKKRDFTELANDYNEDGDDGTRVKAPTWGRRKNRVTEDLDNNYVDLAERIDAYWQKADPHAYTNYTDGKEDNIGILTKAFRNNDVDWLIKEFDEDIDNYNDSDVARAMGEKTVKELAKVANELKAEVAKLAKGALKEDLDLYSKAENAGFDLLHVDEVFEGMMDNADDETIDNFNRVINSVARKLKAKQNDIAILISRDDLGLTGGTPLSKRGDLLFYDTPMVSEKVNGITWLYFPNEEIAYNWLSEQDSLNESLDDNENYARSYYDRNYRGLEDDIVADDVSELESWIWGKLQNGGYVDAVINGVHHRYSPDKVEYGDEVYGIEDYMVE